MQFVTISDLSKMLLKGSNRIIENQELIDAINVFPVADSDTGNNLANTVLPIKKILASTSFNNINNLTDAVLKTAFASSRGNSGIMMVSYLKGFLTPLKDKESFSLAYLSKGAKEGYNESKNSIENPLKGTMLDVMDAFSLSLAKELTNNNVSLIDVFYKATWETKKALIATEGKLKILKTNHVVDAGALGFTLFAYGLYEGLSGVKLELSDIDTKLVHKHSNKTTGIGRFPFEVQFTLQNSQFSTRDLRAMLQPLGDCLDILEVEKKIKIHIHTDKPEVVKEAAALTGEVVQIRVVEMRMSNRKSQIAKPHLKSQIF